MSENFGERYLLEEQGREQGGQNYSGALLRLMQVFGESDTKEQIKDHFFVVFKLAIAMDHLRFPDDSPKTCMNRIIAPG